MLEPDHIITMCKMTEENNSYVDWRAKRFPWYRAIWSECAELMDHYGWKWWGTNYITNMSHVELEMVDILHFALFYELEFHRNNPNINDDIAHHIAHDQLVNFENFDIRELSIIKLVEAIATHALTRHTMHWAAFAKLMQLLNINSTHMLTTFIGKSTLNKYRHNQKKNNGFYDKKWDGKTDSEHLIAILNDTDYLHPKQFESCIYDRLVKLPNNTNPR